jgi:hypothetical protein
MRIDAYTHFAPLKLTEYLARRAGRPLVFAKVGNGHSACCIHSLGSIGQEGCGHGSVCGGRHAPAPEGRHDDLSHYHALSYAHDSRLVQLFDRIPLLTDPDRRVAFMDEHGIDAHVLVPLPWLESVPEVNANPEW